MENNSKKVRHDKYSVWLNNEIEHQQRYVGSVNIESALFFIESAHLDVLMQTKVFNTKSDNSSLILNFILENLIRDGSKLIDNSTSDPIFNLKAKYKVGAWASLYKRIKEI